ncbi:lipocalin family protein [Thiomicrospira pelophila]|uniref:lipocalin family protein n=1 Tax=Thiomicrospira pelophila TaxID=934 RepID=UPI0004A7174F|nr:lipocalin family protein [Thiomicrospira pelophila]
MSWLLAGALLLSGCTSLPDKVEPVTSFELDRYLGEWHELARLDHSFERGLTQVSAHYSMREDGGVRVVNRGFDTEKQAWKEAVGKAYFVDSEDIGRLKVSFFGPFYGAYNIAKLDEGYTMALVIGPNLDYAWLLARDPQPSQGQCEAYLAEADRIGVNREDWIWLKRCD